MSIKRICKATLLAIEKIAQSVHLDFYNRQYRPTAQTNFIVHLPSMPSKLTQHLYALVREEAQKLEDPLMGQHVGYGTDAGHLSTLNIDLLVGVGPFGGGIHSDEEYLDPSSFEKRKFN